MAAQNYNKGNGMGAVHATQHELERWTRKDTLSITLATLEQLKGNRPSPNDTEFLKALGSILQGTKGV